MFHKFLIIVIISTITNAGHLGIGINSGGYGGLLGSTVSQQSTSTSIANGVASAPAIVAAPAVHTVAAPLAVSAPIVHTVPTATSSQSRIDVINPRPLVSQVVSSVPVNVAVGGYATGGYGGTIGGGYGGGIGAGYGGSIGGGYGGNIGGGYGGGIGGGYGGGYGGLEAGLATGGVSSIVGVYGNGGHGLRGY